VAPLAGVVLASWLAFCAAPQDPETDADVAAAIERVQTGLYDVAERDLSEILAERSDHVDARLWRARVRLTLGKIDEARADADAILAAHAGHSEALLVRAECLARRGKYEEAVASARSAAVAPHEAEARALVSSLLDAAGDDGAARAEAEAVVKAADDRKPSTARERLALGRALERLGQFEDASDEFAAAADAPDAPPEAKVALGDLYFRVYREAAGTSRSSGEQYQEVLKVNPRHVGALLGIYRIGSANYQRDSAKTEQALQDVLSIDPRHPEALRMRGISLFNDRRFDDAERCFRTILEDDPRELDARAEMAALHFVRNRADAFREVHDADAAARKKDPRLPRVLGGHLRSLYRFADAVPFLEEALARSPDDADALTILGECQAQLGREKEALATLSRAEELEHGFKHPWRENMLQILEAVKDEYVSVPSSNFDLFVHPDDVAVAGAVLSGFYEEARRDYAKRYGWLPPGKTNVELFRQWEDFSVRTIGQPGFPALGVTFGPLITSVSPLADEIRGKFSYVDTAWHEYAHVVHLGISRSRVPRWFTEGLATLEEKKRSPAHDRNMELELLEARATDSIYPVLHLNAAFRSSRILFGYYQGGLLCEVLEQRTSFAKLVEALELFGKDLSLEEVLRRAFGLSPAELDRELLAFVDRKLASVKVRPRLDAKTTSELRVRVARAPKDVDALRSLAWALAKQEQFAEVDGVVKKLFAVSPDDADGWLVRGEVFLARRRPDDAASCFAKGFAAGAEEFFARLHHAALLDRAKDAEGTKAALRAAIAAFPRFADASLSPHLRLAKKLAAEGATDESVALIEQFCRNAGSAIEPRLELAGHYEETGDAASVARVLGEVLEVDPYRRDEQRRCALALLSIGRADDAVQHARLGRAVAPGREPKRSAGPGAPPRPPSKDAETDTAERAELFAIEAEALLAGEHRPEAIAAAKEALALDADNARATAVSKRAASGGVR